MPVSRQKQYRNDEFIKKVGLKIRAIRTEKGISQEQLAYECNLELSQINRIELGKINTSISQLFLIAEVLKIPVSDLVK